MWRYKNKAKHVNLTPAAEAQMYILFTFLILIEYLNEVDYSKMHLTSACWVNHVCSMALKTI